MGEYTVYELEGELAERTKQRDDLDFACAQERLKVLALEQRIKELEDKLEFHLATKGDWPMNDLRRAFVAGAKWWEFDSTGGTMWQSDQRKVKAEAERRYSSPEEEEK